MHATKLLNVLMNESYNEINEFSLYGASRFFVVKTELVFQSSLSKITIEMTRDRETLLCARIELWPMVALNLKTEVSP